MESMPEETVVLKVFATEMDANMAQDILRDEGIKAFVFKDDAGGMEPQLQPNEWSSLSSQPCRC